LITIVKSTEFKSGLSCWKTARVSMTTAWKTVHVVVASCSSSTLLWSFFAFSFTLLRTRVVEMTISPWRSP